MVAYTTLLQLRKPTVGADPDSWGGHLNDAMDVLDTLFAQINPVQHRLSLTTAVPVTVSDVTAASTLYMTPDKGNGIVSFDGTYWDVVAQAELSMALSSDSGHAGFHQAGKLFDVFYFDDAGTKRIGTGPAWTNDTTRSSGITRLNGVYVNTSSMTVRFGSASGNTVTLAANRGTWLGTIYCTANGQTEDSAAKRMVWNAYNRRPRSMRVIEGTDTWNYSTASYRQANNSTANQLAMVRGLDEDEVFAQVVARVVHSAAAYVSLSVGIGLGSSTVNSATTFRRASTNDGSAGPLGMPTAEYVGFPGLGYRDLRWLEIGAGSGTQTWVGDAGGNDQCGMLGRVMA